MTPSPTDLALDLARRLREEIVPELTGFRAGNVGMTAAILDMLGEQWDGAAARLVEENDAFRALLEHGSAPAPAPRESLRVSALEAENAVLRAGLIDLHADAETRGDRSLLDAIWAELARSVERRRVSSANF